MAVFWYARYFYCSKGGHWFLKCEVVEGVSGALLCPVHRQKVKTSDW